MTPPNNSDSPPIERGGYLGLVAAIGIAATLALGAIWLFHRPGRIVPVPPGDPFAAAYDFAAPQFSLTDQEGKSISNKDLQGKLWIANFVFTRCAGPCPAMSAQMAALTRRISGDNMRFVSFTVDPTHDKPQVLREYAARYDADATRWLLLTEPETSYLDIAEGFRVMAKPSDGSHPIIHSERFFLIDSKGQVRGSYLWNDPESMDRLVADANAMRSAP